MRISIADLTLHTLAEEEETRISLSFVRDYSPFGHAMRVMTIRDPSHRIAKDLDRRLGR